MSSRPTKLQRWLDLVAYLASRRAPASTDEVWAAVPAYARGLDGSDRDKAAVRRQFERDKDELRELGIAIEAVRFHVAGEEESHGYRLSPADVHLPYLRLVEAAEAEEEGPGEDEAGPSAAPAADPGTGETPPAPSTRTAGTHAPARTSPAPPPGTFELRRGEAAAALEGLRELSALPAFPLAREARSAFRKLAFDLDPALAAEPPVVWVEDPEAAAAAPLLARLSDALLARKSVSFDYHAMHRDARERRTARPWGLLFQHGRWYLVAEDAERTEPRMFRLGRMEALEVNSSRPGTPDYEIPADFDLSAWGGRSAWELGEDEDGPVEATVLFRFPRALWAERNALGERLEERADGSQLRRFTVRRRDPFLRWLLSLGGDAVVAGPDELAEEFQEMVRAVARRYADPEGSGG